MLSASPLKSLLPICHLTYPLVFPLPSPNPAPAALPSDPLVSPVFPSWVSYLEGILCYSGHNFFERDTGGQGMSMVNDRFPIRSIPYVYLQTAATPLQGPARTPTPRRQEGSMSDLPPRDLLPTPERTVLTRPYLSRALQATSPWTLPCPLLQLTLLSTTTTTAPPSCPTNPT